ncbi:MAG: hypothetical protein KKB51_10495 [Candidatus Riflebacteria bacterium]|nr:hypothetical protein [Candidatus Riflebacteria bacterium]
MKFFSSKRSAALLSALMALSAVKLLASGMLILPMPGQKQIDKASATINAPAKKNDAKTTNKSEAILPLPTHIKPVPLPKPTPPETPTQPRDKPLIQIAPPQPVLADDIPVPPDEVEIGSSDSFNDLLPPAPPPEVPVEGSQALPVYPKDTSSAIFMVMKSWQCENYDANTLLAHAVEVYSKEADDTFKIEGLSSTAGDFLVTVEEEDITLDELLDILAMKAGRDWGVDIPSKVIYFYPKGVTTDAYNVW